MSQDPGRLAALEQRLRVQEDLIEIANLKARYIHTIDCGWDRVADPEGALTLFAPNGIWAVEGIGSAQGHAEIRTLFTRFAATVPFAYHRISNPLLEVDGDRAKGEWHLIGLVTSRGNLGEASQGTGELFAATIYFDEFVRLDGRWRLDTVRERIVFFQPFSAGWRNAPELAARTR